jgi:hypothetical protein
MPILALLVLSVLGRPRQTAGVGTRIAVGESAWDELGQDAPALVGFGPAKTFERRRARRRPHPFFWAPFIYMGLPQ